MNRIGRIKTDEKRTRMVTDGMDLHGLKNGMRILRIGRMGADKKEHGFSLPNHQSSTINLKRGSSRIQARSGSSLAHADRPGRSAMACANNSSARSTSPAML